MKKVCGTCNFRLESRPGNRIEVLCAHDNQWRKDNTPACDKWIEYIANLTPQDRLSLVAFNRQTLLAEEANRLDAEAISIARDANRIALSAFSEARRANRSRWKDRTMTMIAIIIAMIAAHKEIGSFMSWLLKLFKSGP